MDMHSFFELQTSVVKMDGESKIICLSTSVFLQEN